MTSLKFGQLWQPLHKQLTLFALPHQQRQVSLFSCCFCLFSPHPTCCQHQSSSDAPSSQGHSALPTFITGLGFFLPDKQVKPAGWSNKSQSMQSIRRGPAQPQRGDRPSWGSRAGKNALMSPPVLPPFSTHATQVCT